MSLAKKMTIQSLRMTSSSASLTRPCLKCFVMNITSLVLLLRHAGSFTKLQEYMKFSRLFYHRVLQARIRSCQTSLHKSNKHNGRGQQPLPSNNNRDRRPTQSDSPPQPSTAVILIPTQSVPAIHGGHKWCLCFLNPDGCDY